MSQRCLLIRATLFCCIFTLMGMGCGGRGSPYGSGIFGEWVTDPYGLPAYLYRFSLSDPRSYYTVRDTGSWEPERRNDHYHLIGNERTLVRCFNDGSAELIAPLRLFVAVNYHAPSRGLGTGGYGMLFYPGGSLSTRFEANARILFGEGYCKKEVRDGAHSITQYLFSPDGRDPVLISLSQVTGSGEYEDAFEITPVVFTPLSPETKRLHYLKQQSRNAETFNVNGLPWAKFTFDGMPERITFFVGAAAAPAKLEISETLYGYTVKVKYTYTSNTPYYCTLLGFRTGKDPTVTALAYRYRDRCNTALEDLINAIKEEAPLFDTEPSYLKRETSWHYSYLRSGFISGGSGTRVKTSGFQSYGYVMGTGYSPGFAEQAPAPGRDLSQHAEALAVYNPAFAREILELVLEQVPQDVSITWWHIPGVIAPSDYALFLMWAVERYVLVTGNFSFLDTNLRFYDEGTGSVWEHLTAAYNYLKQRVGKGPHGLIRIMGGDWNDAVVFAAGTVEGAGWQNVMEEGESVLNTAMASYIFPRFAELARMRGDTALADELEEEGQAMCDALEYAWAGKWYARMLLTSTRSQVQGNIIGSDRMYLEPQPWAIMSGCADRYGHTRVLIESIRNELLSRSPIGAPLISQPVGHGIGGRPGEGHDGGVWPLLNGWLVRALAKAEPTLASSLYLRNTLAYHAEVFPSVWIGIWSAFDSYNISPSPRPGFTWDQLPFYDMNIAPISHPDPHFSQLGALLSLLGIEFEINSIRINAPAWENNFYFKTPILEIKFSEGTYSLNYKPLEGQPLHVSVETDTLPLRIAREQQ